MATPDQAGAPGVGSLSSCPHPGTLLAPSGQHQPVSLISLYLHPGHASTGLRCHQGTGDNLPDEFIYTFRPKIDILLPHQYLYFQVYDPFGWLCWPGSRGYS